MSELPDRPDRLSESASGRPQGGSQRGPLDAPEDRWSFGGGSAIETSAGVLVPEVLLVGAGHAVLNASLMPSGTGEPAIARPRRLLVPRTPLASLVPVTVIDDRGALYTVHPEGMSGRRGPSGKPAGPMSVDLGLDPVPAPEVSWLELHGQDGAATRLLRSARPAVRIGQLGPVALSPAERKLSDQAFWLIELRINGASDDFLRQRCSAALDTIAEIQRSAQLDAASELPDQLMQLCAVLTKNRRADGLPGSWSGMLEAARRADGRRLHLDACAVLPPIDGVTVQVDTMISTSEGWRLYLRATPGWWNYSEDGHQKWNPVSVDAADDRGGTYLSIFGGSAGRRGNEELALMFLPRLDPLARALKLTCRGASQEVVVDLGLVPAAGRADVIPTVRPGSHHPGS